MAMEAISAVEEAEAAANRAKADAAQLAKHMAAVAEDEGREAVKAALEKARETLENVEKEADQRIAADAERIRSETQAQMDALRSRAELRLGEAADKIVERIVNGS